MAAETWPSWELYDAESKRWMLLTTDILDPRLDTLFRTIAEQINHPLALCIKWKRYDKKRMRCDIMRPYGIGFDPCKLIRNGYDIVHYDVPVKMGLYRNGFLPESEIVVLYTKTENINSGNIEILIFDSGNSQVCIAVPKNPMPQKQVSAPPVLAFSTASACEKITRRKSKTESDLAQAVLFDLSDHVSRLSVDTPAQRQPANPPKPVVQPSATETSQPTMDVRRIVGRRDFMRVSMLEQTPK